MKYILLIFVLLITCVNAAITPIADNRKALVPIIISKDASEFTKQNASDLAAMLQRISGAEFNVRTDEEAHGIILGNVTEFSKVPDADKLNTDDSLRREEYLLKSDGQNLWLIGATDAGASHAVWDFLYRLGYRQYFPGEEWEIVPSLKTITADFDAYEVPDYKVRRFAWHYGNWNDVEGTDTWLQRNRIPTRPGKDPARNFPPLFTLNTGHAYGGIIKAFKDQLDSDPHSRSIGTKTGQPTGKLNPSSKVTQDVVKAYAANYFEKNPESTSISMDPSDGGGWGNSPEELAIGTPSDRVVFLANLAAKEVNKDSKTIRYVGIYAYNEHSPAPTKQHIDPHVIVSIATSFIHGGFTIEQLLEAWRKAGVQMMGIREYHSVVAWDGSLPTRGRAANLDYLTKTIPEFYQTGVRFYTTEAGFNWASQGIGNYLTTRILWNIEEAKNKDAILDEFIANCFPEAKEPMTHLFRDILYSGKPAYLTRDLLGRMYKSLDEAKKLTKETVALKRIDDFIEYTRYVELRFEFGTTRTLDKMAEVIKFAYQTRKNHMLSSYALFRDLPVRNKDLKRPENTDHRVSEDKNPWKNSEPITSEEINEWLANGVANNPTADFEPVAFSKNLVPASQLPFASDFDANREPLKKSVSGNNYSMRNTKSIYTWYASQESTLHFNVKPGKIYTNRGNLSVALYPMTENIEQLSGEKTDTEDSSAEEKQEENNPVFQKAIQQFSFEPDRQDHSVDLKAENTGGYIVTFRDQAGGYDVLDWDSTFPFTFEASMDVAPILDPRRNPVFYVPKGTKIFGVFASGGEGTVLGPNNEEILQIPEENGFYSTPVPAGTDGHFWSFTANKAAPKIRLLTTPPYMAPNAMQLMIPKEVLDADLTTE